MKKATAIKRAKGVRKLADLLGITTQAVYKWPLEVPRPSLQKLRELRPSWFNTKGKKPDDQKAT